MRALLVALMVVASGLTVPAAALACKLTKVDAAAKAELKVYFTRFLKEDQTDGKYKRCRIVKSGGTTFFITPFRQDANVIVHKSNWAR